MVPLDEVLKGSAKPWIFMTFLGGRKWEKTWKCRMNMVRCWSPELSTLAKWSPKKSRKILGVFSPPKNNFLRVLSKSSGCRGSRIPGPLRKFKEFTIQKAGPQIVSSFPKQCLHYGVLAFSRAGDCGPPGPGSRTRKIIKKPSVFKLFQKKMVLALEFGGPPFHFLRNASANLLVFVQSLVWPHNSASSATWRPMELQKDYKDHQGYSKHKWWET